MHRDNDPTTARADEKQGGPAGRAAEVFLVFLRLGLTSFGGPVAHLGYFHAEFVSRRRWLSEAAWAELVALCQFLPGPASSQAGFALGLLRAGWRGAFLAFLGFTLPSALLLFCLALSASRMEGPLASGAFHGLKLVAVAVVAQAVLGMVRSLCPDRARAAIAVLAVALIAAAPPVLGMSLAILTGGAMGLTFLRGSAAPLAAEGIATLAARIPRRLAIGAAIALALILFALPLLPQTAPGLNLAVTFSHAGALVFGGGHVVLPLLEAGTVGQGHISETQFLAGYAAAQAVPGPLFTFAAWLGALHQPGPDGLTGALIALIALFTPGFLILIAALPFWSRLRRARGACAAISGANAAVTGLLGAALYDPVFTSAVGNLQDLALALACFAALSLWKLPPWAVVLAGAAGGMALSLIP